MKRKIGILVLAAALAAATVWSVWAIARKKKRSGRRGGELACDEGFGRDTARAD